MYKLIIHPPVGLQSQSDSGLIRGMHLSWLLRLSIFLPSLSSAAAPLCGTEVRLDRPGGTMYGVKARDQGQVGDCFAQAASTYMRALQQQAGVAHPIEPSATALAAGIAAEKHYNIFAKGGDPCSALAYAKKNGVCPAEAVENKNNEVNESLVRKFNESSQLGETLKQSYDSLAHVGSKREPKKSCLMPNPVLQEIPDRALMSALISESCDVGPVLQKVLQNCKASNLKNPLEGLDLSCRPYPDTRQASRQVSANEYTDKLKEILNRPHALPAMIGFCSTILTRGKNQAGGTSKDSCGAHAAVVMGYRECDHKILLRNSWGTECDHYPEELQSDCEPGTGNIWVDEKKLGENMLRLIDPPTQPK